jgi:FkbM family methyltransferase
MKILPFRYREALSQEISYILRYLLHPSLVSIDGVRLRATHTVVTTPIRLSMYSQNYERAEREIVGSHLDPDDVVLEIGAGIGFISAFCAKRIGSNQVHAFEANPALEPAIRDTYSLNAVSPALTMACVAREEGNRTLYVQEHFVGSSMIEQDSSSQVVNVTQVDLGRLLKEIKPSFVIVDIEGFEAELLDNAELEGVRKICVELHPGMIGDAACSRLVAGLIDQGFALEIDSVFRNVAYFSRPV